MHHAQLTKLQCVKSAMTSAFSAMPSRIIRDAILHSERYHSIGVEAKVLFFELLLNADDYGLVPMGHIFLRMHCPTCSGEDNA